MRRQLTGSLAMLAAGTLYLGAVAPSHADVEVGWGDETSNADGSRRVRVDVRSSTGPPSGRPARGERGRSQEPPGSAVTVEADSCCGGPSAQVWLGESRQDQRDRLTREIPDQVLFEEDYEGPAPLRGVRLMIPGPQGNLRSRTVPLPTVAVTPSLAPTAIPLPPDLEALVDRALLALDLPAPDLHLGPDPAANQWGMVPVGHPLWVWTTPPQGRTTSLVHSGVQLTLNAEPAGLRVDAGDGTIRDCATTTPFTAAHAPDQASPTCGMRYSAIPAGGRARIEGRQLWQLSFHTDDGRRGTRTTSTARHIDVAVGSVQSILRPGESS